LEREKAELNSSPTQTYTKATEKELTSLIQLLVKRMDLSLSLKALMALAKVVTSSMSTRAQTTLTERNTLLTTHTERMVELSSSIQVKENTLLSTTVNSRESIFST